MNLYHISTEQETQRFYSHLNISENKRILFSGLFGSGKTTFLHEFFESKEEYIPIFLRPVNYSIAPNKDIFEYIKVDILFELLKFASAENTKFSNKELLPEFIANEIYSILGGFIKVIPTIGKPLHEISSILTNSVKRYKEHKASKNKNEYSEIEQFIKCQSENIGSIFEENDITYAIRNIINKFREDSKTEGSSSKKIILVIDDLDRIDPEHIFRILNVFACNADTSFYGESLNNKFEFDKIMVVCDINNLRYLFAHKYGSSTDFCGYIDKFFSLNVYHFNLKDDMVNSLNQLIVNFNSQNHLYDVYPQQYIIYWILRDLILNDLISLRSLHNINVIKLDTHGYHNFNKYVYAYDSIYVLYQYMKAIYITDKKIDDVLLSLHTKKINTNFSQGIQFIAGYFCQIIYHFQTNRNEIKGDFFINVGGKLYECEMKQYNMSTFASLKTVYDINKKELSNFNIYELVEEALTECKQIIYYGDRMD